MNPLSDFSVASSVVTFLGFGGKLVSRFGEIKGSGKGQPLTVLNMERSAEGLTSVAAAAQKKMKFLGSSYIQLSESLTHSSQSRIH